MTATYRRYPTYRVNAVRPRFDQPMSQMNTTPLIDVLLGLLIMIILSVPVMTHNLEVDLPGPGGVADDAPQVALTLDPAGQAFWNGEAVDRATLGFRLGAAARQTPEPVIRFQPDPLASYADAVQVINLADDAGTGRFAFVGNEQHRSFGRD